MDDMNLNDFLAHYGVLGMKWGVRRASKSTGSGGKSGKKSSSLKNKISKMANKKKEVKSMSNEELRKRIQRLEMERRYKELKRGDIARGSKIAREVLEGSARAIGQEIVRYGVGTGINAVTGRNVINIHNSKKKKA